MLILTKNSHILTTWTKCKNPGNSCKRSACKKCKNPGNSCKNRRKTGRSFTRFSVVFTFFTHGVLSPNGLRGQ